MNRLLTDNIERTTPRRSLWAPRHEPMTAWNYAGATLIAVAAILAGWLWLAATP